jgi:hypothetical protein
MRARRANTTDLLRKRLNARFPEATIYFEAANMTSQILNFGLPAPIDVQIMGRNAEANYALAREVERQVGHIPAPRTCTFTRSSITPRSA